MLTCFYFEESTVVEPFLKCKYQGMESLASISQAKAKISGLVDSEIIKHISTEVDKVGKIIELGVHHWNLKDANMLYIWCKEAMRISFWQWKLLLLFQFSCDIFLSYGTFLLYLFISLVSKNYLRVHNFKSVTIKLKLRK